MWRSLLCGGAGRPWPLTVLCCGPADASHVWRRSSHCGQARPGPGRPLRGLSGYWPALARPGRALLRTEHKRQPLPPGQRRPLLSLRCRCVRSLATTHALRSPTLASLTVSTARATARGAMPMGTTGSPAALTTSSMYGGRLSPSHALCTLAVVCCCTFPRARFPLQGVWPPHGHGGVGERHGQARRYRRGGDRWHSSRDQGLGALSEWGRSVPTPFDS
jgi:hypothetical protein